MAHALDPRWDSKESLCRSIKKLVGTAGGKIRRLGTSDCFEVQIEGRSPLLLALKETGKDQRHHKESQTSWIGIPEQLLGRVLELVEQKITPDVYFLLIDYWDKHLVIIPLKDALGTMFKRDRKGANIHFSFNLKKTLSGYSVQTRRDEPDIPVKHIDTLTPLIALMQKV